MSEPVLRPYQADLRAGVYREWGAGKRAVLAVLPTGGGKSVIIARMEADAEAANEPSIVIAHRQELVGQMSLHVGRAGVQHRIIAPDNVIAYITAEHRREFGRSYVSPNARHYIAGVDTLISRSEQLQDWGRQIKRWTIDEAHHLLTANKWGTAVSLFPNAFGIGVTATPSRADGKGLGLGADGLIDVMLIGPSMRELIDAGSLTDYEIVVPESDFDVDALRVGDSGDYSTKAMREASEASGIVGDVVTSYIVYAAGKRGITFATDVQTAGEIAERYNAFGIPAAAVSAKTNDAVRADYIRRFRSGQLLQLVNVDILGEGFDVPAVEVVSMARPTASLAVYMQQFGRALRPLQGKQNGLIIDHVSNVKRHGFPDKPRYWTLGARERKARNTDEDIELTICLNCKHPFESVKRACPKCGWVRPIEPRISGGRSELERIEGDLMLLDAATLATMRQATELMSPGAKASQAAYSTGSSGIGNKIGELHAERIAEQGRLREALAMWGAKQRALGRPDDESYRRFYKATGVDVLTAQTLKRDEMQKLREEIEKWGNLTNA